MLLTNRVLGLLANYRFHGHFRDAENVASRFFYQTVRPLKMRTYTFKLNLFVTNIIHRFRRHMAWKKEFLTKFKIDFENALDELQESESKLKANKHPPFNVAHYRDKITLQMKASIANLFWNHIVIEVLRKKVIDQIVSVEIARNQAYREYKKYVLYSKGLVDSMTVLGLDTIDHFKATEAIAIGSSQYSSILSESLKRAKEHYILEKLDSQNLSNKTKKKKNKRKKMKYDDFLANARQAQDVTEVFEFGSRGETIGNKIIAGWKRNDKQQGIQDIDFEVMLEVCGLCCEYVVNLDN